MAYARIQSYRLFIRPLIRTEQWDDILLFETWWARVRNQNEVREGKEEREGREEQEQERAQQANEWLSSTLLQVHPMTDAVYHTVLRLFHVSTPSEWACMLGGWDELAPLRTVRWLVEEKEIVVDWNTSRMNILSAPLKIACITPGEEGVEYMTYLLKNGADPMLPCHGRQPLFMTFVCTSLTGILPFGREECLRRAEILLEHGADPMLPDGNGLNTMDLVCGADEFTAMDEGEKAAWMALLGRYA